MREGGTGRWEEREKEDQRPRERDQRARDGLVGVEVRERGTSGRDQWMREGWLGGRKREVRESEGPAGKRGRD